MRHGILFAENVQTVVSVLLAAALLGARPVAKDPQLRKDAGGAIKYFAGSLLAHLLAAAIGAAAHPGRWPVYFDALGLLLFTWGLCRTVVGLGIWALRSRRGKHTPKIFRDVVDSVLYAVCVVVVLHATLRLDLTSLVATSAAVSVMIGLALQETLGNLFAGLSLQLEHPFQVGDWISVGTFVGQVAQVAWRGTKLHTLRREQVTVPNSTVAKANVVNYSRHGRVARDLTLGLSYAVPPNRARAVLLDVLSGLPQVLREPAPCVYVLGYDDSAITYLLRFFVDDFENVEAAVDAVLSTAWYRLAREGMEVPFPHRTVQLHRAPKVRNVSAAEGTHDDTLQLLGAVDFLKPLGEQGRDALALRVTREAFGEGEAILRAGESGDSFHIVVDGEVRVRAHVGGREQDVARLGRGGFFGEMSLLTGEPRSATVVAATDAVLLTMHRADFAEVLAEHGAVAQELADILGRRRAELAAAQAEPGAQLGQARAESRRIFGILRELFKVSE